MAAASGASQVSIIPHTELAFKMDNEITRRFSKAKWVTIVKLYYILAKYGGLPYGGATRDYIARINAADSYYAHCKEEGINAETNYNNPSVHPKSFGDRNKLPIDVDVFITKGNFDKLIKILESTFKLVKKPCLPNYFFESCDLFKGALTHEKWEIDLFNFPDEYIMTILFGKSIRRSHCALSIDFVIINDRFLEHEEYLNKGILYPPFGNPDFDVNLLSFTIDSNCNIQIVPLPYLETMHTLSISSIHPLHSYEINKAIMDSVIANINNKRARPVFPIEQPYIEGVFKNCKGRLTSEYRIYKMLCKRYKIDYYNTILPPDVLCCWSKDTTECNPEETCSVCKEVFTNEDRAFNACSMCPSKMHLMCFRDFLEKLHTPDTEHNCISCAECGKIPFTENYPCELINFLINLTIQINKPTATCETCKQVRVRCKCWVLKCNT